MTTLMINGKQHAMEAEDSMPLLWAIRDIAGLTGTKFGCGMGLCGACSIHLDGKITRSCITPVSAAKNKSIFRILSLKWAKGLIPRFQR
jgi:isoquinoline 1-oxidoreductase alpha subunit